LGTLQVVAGGANAQRIVAGLELARREAEPALVVADTLTVTMPFLALTTTPSIAPSSVDVTLPVTAAGAPDWA
jgi:hypothetical protein